MKPVTSELLVLPVGRGTRLGFWSVGIHVVGEFRIRDREARRRGMVRPGCKFPMKPERANLRPILIAHAMRHKSSICNSHKILSGCSTRPAEREGILTDGPTVFKSNVL